MTNPPIMVLCGSTKMFHFQTIIVICWLLLHYLNFQHSFIVSPISPSIMVHTPLVNFSQKRSKENKTTFYYYNLCFYVFRYLKWKYIFFITKEVQDLQQNFNLHMLKIISTCVEKKNYYFESRLASEHMQVCNYIHFWLLKGFRLFQLSV